MGIHAVLFLTRWKRLSIIFGWVLTTTHHHFITAIYSPYWFVCVLCADKWLSDADLLSFHVVISKGERHHDSWLMMIDNNNHGCLWYLQCSKMRSIASVSVFERLYVSLGIITYLDTAKGLKTAYREFFHKDTQYQWCLIT